MEQSARVRQHSAPAIRARSAERGRWHTSVPPAQRPAVVGGLSQGTYSGFKVAVAVIVFHFGVKMLVQFADILLPFIMALLLCTVLEPVKQVTLEVLECTLIVLFQRVSCCGCCLRRVRRETLGGEASDSGATPASGVRGSRTDLHELMKRFLLLVSITITVLLAGRLFWLVGRVVWLSGEAVTHDFPYYRSGVEKRGSQVQHLLKRFHLQNQAHVDMEHIGHWALRLLQYSAEFLTQHVFYTLTQISLTTIFVLFLLYSPVQRDFSPVMRVVFESMELYLKLKTLISMTMGVTNGIALAIIGLELPAAWGLLTFLANFIPNIGGPVMSILPCVIALLDVRKSFYQVSAAFLAQFFLHFNIANFVEPVVFGTTEEIHSVVVLLGLSFFGYIWGFTGMFLSVPMLFAIHAWLKTVAQSVNCAQEARDDARFIMGILEGRWLADDDFGVEDTSLFLGPMDARTEGPDSPAVSKEVDTSQAFQVHGMGALAEDRPTPTRGRGEPMRQESMGGGEADPPSMEIQPPISNWKVTTDLQAIFAVRDPDTDEVRLQGLIWRWVVLAGAYILVFFGFAIFHWDLHSLIHPSREPLRTVGSLPPGGGAAAAGEAALTSAEPTTTAVLAATTTVVAAAVEATTTVFGSLAAGAATAPTYVGRPTSLAPVADASPPTTSSASPAPARSRPSSRPPLAESAGSEAAGAGEDAMAAAAAQWAAGHAGAGTSSTTPGNSHVSSIGVSSSSGGGSSSSSSSTTSSTTSSSSSTSSSSTSSSSRSSSSRADSAVRDRMDAGASGKPDGELGDPDEPLRRPSAASGAGADDWPSGSGAGPGGPAAGRGDAAGRHGEARGGAAENGFVEADHPPVERAPGGAAEAAGTGGLSRAAGREDEGVSRDIVT